MSDRGKMVKELEIAKKIKNKVHQTEDIVCRELKFLDKLANVMFIQDITDFQIISDYIIKPLQNLEQVDTDLNFADFVAQEVVQGREVKIVKSIDEAIEEMLKGKTLVILQDERKIVVVDSAKFITRAIAEPPTSSVLQGPREGFNESIKNNISLVRRRLSSPNFVIKNLKLGRKTKTLVSLMYLDDVVQDDTVKKIYEKLKQIDVDGILDSHYIAQYLQIKPNSIFMQIGTTEKPDILVAKLLEGRVGILVDGSPLVLTLPFVVWENFQSSEDYYTNHHHATFVRWLRLIGVFFSILLPGSFVAVQLFHYGIIPLKFLVTIINTTEGLPFTPLVEMLFIVLLFELLNEASLRMPKYLGMAMSIVGALILGETAVNAGLISPPAVMIVALSSMTTFTVADLSNQLSILRLGFILVGAGFGLVGVILGMVWLISYLADLDSYGTPFLAPLAPYVRKDMKDFLHVASRIDMVENIKSIKNKNKIRSKIPSYKNKK